MIALTALTTAWAQLAPSGHPDVPAASVAAEDGWGAGWINPANLGYDRDPRYAVALQRPFGVPQEGVLAVTGGVQGQQLGVVGLLDGDRTAWSVDWSGGFELPQRLAVGASTRWHARPGAHGYSVDLAISSRPTPWLGLSLVSRSLLAGGATRYRGSTHLGVAVRPVDALVLGAETALREAFDARDPAVVEARGTLRLRARRGLYVRAFGAGTPALREVAGGGALEVFFGGVGVGAAGQSSGDAGLGTAWVGSGEPGETALRRRADVPVVDLTRAPAYEPTRGLLGGDPGPSWLEVCERLRALERDPSVAAVLIPLGSAPLGRARLAELRARIVALEAAGKPVVAYLNGSVDSSTYEAATAASRVVLHPAGAISLVGVSIELNHYGALLDDLGIQAQIARRSDYKTAGESYSHAAPTAEQREQLDAWLDDAWDALVRGIAAGREVSEDEARAWIAGGPYPADEAREKGLVDRLAHPDEIEALLKGALGRAPRLHALASRPEPDDPWAVPRRVAVIYVDGPIATGRSSGGGLLGGRAVGSATVVEQLDRARNDDTVRAVVLRVDSPGGSAFGSEEILRAVERLRAADKPVVASMGSLAGSGGYYVAAKANAIWAHPTTLTGSIGVISVKLSPSPLLERLGVHITRLERGEHTGIDSPLLPWSDADRARVQVLIDATYDRFKSHVATGRGLDDDAVEAVAQGRVWSGRAAADRGLVDGLGGLDEAIADAIARAGLDRERVELFSYPPPRTLTSALAPLSPLGVAPGLAQVIEPWSLLTRHPEERVWAIEPWAWSVR